MNCESKICLLENVQTVNIYIYIYAFSRRFYPKRLTLHSSYSFYILSALAFPGNRTHDLGVARAMLYHLSYRKVDSVCHISPSEKNSSGLFPFFLLVSC